MTYKMANTLLPASDRLASPMLSLLLSSAALPSLSGCCTDAPPTPPPLSALSELPEDLLPHVRLAHPLASDSVHHPELPPHPGSNNLSIQDPLRSLTCADVCTFPLFLTSNQVSIDVQISDLANTSTRTIRATIDTGGLFELSLPVSSSTPQEIWIPEGSTPVAVATPFGELHEYKGLLRSIEIRGQSGAFTCSPVGVSLVPSAPEDDPLLGLSSLSGFDGVCFDWQAHQLAILSKAELDALRGDQDWSSMDWSLQVRKSLASGGTEDLMVGAGRALKRLPTVEVKCGATAYQALLDTGSTVPLVVHDSSLLAEVTGQVWASGHHHEQTAVQFGTLSQPMLCAGFTIPAGTTAVYMPSEAAGEAGRVIVGFPVLREQSFVLDFVNRKVLFQKASGSLATRAPDQ